MKVNQIYEVVNQTIAEVTGKEALSTENLNDLVEVGRTITASGDDKNFLTGLIDRIAKSIIVSKTYTADSLTKALIRDSWEFGAFLQKVYIKPVDFTLNESFYPNKNESYDCTIYFGFGDVESEVFNKKLTFECDISIPDFQMKTCFESASSLTSFVAAIWSNLESRVSIALSNLAQRAVSLMVCETLYDSDSTGAYTGAGNTRAINVLYLFNQKYRSGASDTPLTAAEAFTDPEFARFLVFYIKELSERLKKMSVLYNLKGWETFSEDPQIVMHSVIANAAEVYLYSDTFHDEYVKLPTTHKVAYWQGTGTNFDESNTTIIKGKDSAGHSITSPRILGCIFDKDAVMLCNENQRVLSNPVPKAEFSNYYAKMDLSLFASKYANFVVLYCQDEAAED